MKKGFTCGTFDLFHAGHVMMLRDCKKQCDYLIVGIQIDPSVDRPDKNKPIQSIVEREIQVRGCKYVDMVLFYENEKDLEDVLSVINVDVRFVGADWKAKKVRGEEICEKRNIKIIYTNRDHGWSTSELRERVKNA